MSKKFSLKTKSGGLWARLTALMVVFMMTATQVNAQQPSVSYLDENGATQTTTNYTLVGSSATAVTWEAGTYVVGADYNSDGVIDATDATAGENSFTITGGATATGTMKLILVDGFTLTLDASESEGTCGFNTNMKNVSIYGQTNQTGTLIGKSGKGDSYVAGIYGDDSGEPEKVTINGGIIYGYGGDYESSSGIATVTVNAGKVYAFGGKAFYDTEYEYATGGCGLTYSVVNGGEVYGTGGVGGYNGRGGDGVAYIEIHGGTIEGIGGAGEASGGVGVIVSSVEGEATISGTGGAGTNGGKGILMNTFGEFTFPEDVNVTAIGGAGTTKGGDGLGFGFGNNVLNITGAKVTATAGDGGSSAAIKASTINVDITQNVMHGADEASAVELERTGKDITSAVSDDKYVAVAALVVPELAAVTYVNANGRKTTINKKYNLINTDSETAVEWAAGTYVVGADYNVDNVIDATDAEYADAQGLQKSFTITGGAKAAQGENNNVPIKINLILVDGFTLTVDATQSDKTVGLSVSYAAVMSIYGQEGQTGMLIAKGGKAADGIYGYGKDKFFINSGTVEAYGGNSAQIGGYWNAGGNGIQRFTVNGGSVFGYGGSQISQDGGSPSSGLSEVILNGGRIEGHGGNSISGYGGRGIRSLTMYGGAVYGYGGNGETGNYGVELNKTGSYKEGAIVVGTVYGVGGNGTLSGNSGVFTSGNMTINSGASLTAIGGNGGTGGGIGVDAGMGNYILTINGGTVTATGGSGTSDGKGIAAKTKYAATNLTVKYGTDASSATILEREGTDFSGVGYAKYVKVYNTTFIVTCEGNDETTPNSLKKALAEIEAGDIIQLGADINLTGTMNVTSNHNFILDLNGHVLQRPNNATTDFSVITNNGILTIIDSSEGKTGKIMGGTGTDVAGTKIGGGIYNMGTLTVNDITIEGNSATKGGGIYNCVNLILNDGTVITGNTTTENNLSAGVYCKNDDSEITLNGKVIIKDNLSNGIVGNLCLNNGNATINTLTEGAVIGVSPLNNDVFAPRAFVGNATSSYAKYFISDNNRYHVIFYDEDNSLKLEAHQWHYIAKDNVLYAYCETESCPHYGTTENLEKAVTYSLVADNMNYSGEQYNGASLVDGGWAELGLTAPTTIEYAGRGATEYQKTTTPPTEIGLYTASVTKTIEPSNSEIVATANFQIKPQITFGCDEGKSVTVLNGETELQSGDFADMEYQIEAEAEPKANFQKWTAGPNGEELSTANPYIFSITQNTVLYGRFNVEINVEANPAEGGNVAIKYTDGDYIVGDARKNITYGASVTIEATSNEGYAFQGWFDTTTGEIFCKTQKLTFDALNSKNLEARFTDQVIWVRVKKGN